MFKVTSVENKELQLAICNEIGVENADNSFAYAAFEVADDGETVLSPIAICEFSFIGGCRIHHLTPMQGHEDDEAVLILGFAVIDFFRRCGFETLTATINEKYALRLGFVHDGDTFLLNLKRPAGCGGH